MDDSHVYDVVLCPEPKGGFSVLVPELPSVATQGETREEALDMAREAIEGYLDAMRDDDSPTPTVEVRPFPRSLDWLISRLAGIYPPDEARRWLVTPHRLLGGDRPADRIRQGHTDDVLALIAQLRDGALV